MDRAPCMDFLLIFSFCLIICSEISQQTVLKIETSDSKDQTEEWTPPDDPLIIAIISRHRTGNRGGKDSENESGQLTIIAAHHKRKTEIETKGTENVTHVTISKTDQHEENKSKDAINAVSMQNDEPGYMENSEDTFKILLHEKAFRKKLLIATMSSSVIVILLLLMVLFCMIFQQYKKTERFSGMEGPDRQYFILPAENVSPLVDSFLSSSTTESLENSLVSEKPLRSFSTKRKEGKLRSSPVCHASRVSSEASFKSKVKTCSSEHETAQRPSETFLLPAKSLQLAPQESSRNQQPPDHFVRLRKTLMAASLASVMTAEKKWSCVSCAN